MGSWITVGQYDRARPGKRETDTQRRDSWRTGRGGQDQDGHGGLPSRVADDSDAVGSCKDGDCRCLCTLNLDIDQHGRTVRTWLLIDDRGLIGLTGELVRCLLLGRR